MENLVEIINEYNNGKKIKDIAIEYNSSISTIHRLLLKNKVKMRKGGTLKMSTEEFIKRAKEVHGDKYDYAKTDLENKDEKGRVIITCLKHGDFFQKPNNHLCGSGCKLCSIEKNRMSTEDFIKRARKVHGDKYDYSKTNLEDRDGDGKIVITCPKHGDFRQLPYSHLQGHICRKCFTEGKTFTISDFIDKANEVHNYKYDYSKSIYLGYFKKMIITCPIHGDFDQTPDNHLHGCGCPKCNSSKLEEEIRMFLRENNIEFEEQKKFDWLGRQSLDFYLPQYNKAIECQGEQHFKSIKGWGGADKLLQITLRDEEKRKLSEKEGIEILYYSNLGIDYPYNVYESKEELLTEI